MTVIEPAPRHEARVTHPAEIEPAAGIVAEPWQVIRFAAGAAVIVETHDGVTSRPVQGQQVIDDAVLVTHGGPERLRHLRKQVMAST